MTALEDARSRFVHARLSDNGYEVPEMEVWHALANWDALNLTAPPTYEESEDLARAIHESFWLMQGGDPESTSSEPINSGDMQLAYDILAAGFRRQGAITDKQVQVARETCYQATGCYHTIEAMQAVLEAALGGA